MQKHLDNQVAIISKFSSHQSNCNFPTFQQFSSGLENFQRTTAEQKYARIFVIFLAMSTNKFQNNVIDHNFASKVREVGHARKRNHVYYTLPFCPQK